MSTPTPLDGDVGAPRPTRRSGPWRRGWDRAAGLAAPWRRDLRTGVASVAAQQVLTLVGVGVAGYCVARAVRGATYAQLSVELLIVVLVALPLVRLPWAGAAALSSVGNRVKVDQAGQVFDAVDRLDPQILDEQRSGAVLAVATHDLATVGSFYSAALPTLVAGLSLMAAALVGLAALDWRLGLLLAAWLAGAGLVITALDRATSSAGATTSAGAAGPAGGLGRRAEIVDDIQGLREIVARGRVDDVLDQLDAHERAHDHPVADDSGAIPAGRADGATRGRVDPASEVVGTLTPLVVLLGGMAMAAHHGVAPTVVVPAVMMATVSGRAWAPLSRARRDLDRFLEATARVAVLTDAPPRSRPEHGPTPATTDVTYAGVDFRYRPDAPRAVADLDFTLSDGETVALVGHSGAGKSTTIRLLLGLLRPAVGTVAVGGHDLAELDEATLRGLIGYVPQDGHLFNTSVRENVRLGRPEATDAEIEAAARDAAAWEFIAALPEGLDTSIGERGGQLSGGQRQRLAMARALLADRPILVLDEPVAHLDADNENLLLAAMARLRVGRTTLIVAHRRSTTRHADRILVLDHGRLVTAGTHEHLLRTDPTYAQLMGPSPAGSGGR